MKNYPIKSTPFEINIWKKSGCSEREVVIGRLWGGREVRMSGGVYPGCPSLAHAHPGGGGGQEMGDQEPAHTLEQGEWNPLLCFLCHQVIIKIQAAMNCVTVYIQTYREPCLLACYHTFCGSCLKGRSLDGKLSCPICGWVKPGASISQPHCDLNQTVTEKSPHYETGTRFLPQIPFYASWSSLPLTSIPPVQTVTEMKRARCFSAILAVSGAE